VSVYAFETPEEFDAHIKAVRQAAMDNNDPADLARCLGPNQEGSYQLNISYALEQDDPTLVIFCRVIGKTEFLAQATDDPDVGLDYYEGRWEDQLKTGFLLTECFSLIEPNGEWGDTHVSRMDITIPEEGWEIAKRDKWYIGEPGNGSATGHLVYSLIKKEEEAQQD